MEKKTVRKSGLQKIFVPGILLLLVLACAASVYLFVQLQKIKSSPEVAAQDEAAEVIEKVGALIMLPTDETPTVATVSDPDMLKDQAFFANAKQGYKVLIFSKAQKAILYDPESNKIVEVAPINVKQDGAAETTNPQEPDVAGVTDENTSVETVPVVVP